MGIMRRNFFSKLGVLLGSKPDSLDGTNMPELSVAEQRLPFENSVKKAYDFISPDTGDLDVQNILLRRIANTAAFQRLRDIRFLGALDYLLKPQPNGKTSNQRFTRYQHSIGVAALAKLYLQESYEHELDQSLCLASALLHDIGHPPLSHTIEQIFEEYFGINHHIATIDAILGNNGHSSEIADLLSRSGVNPQSVADVLNGHGKDFNGFFRGPINFDTIEGILRSRQYFKMQTLGLSPDRVVKAAFHREFPGSASTVDAFWQCKDDIYFTVIRSPNGVFFDALFQGITRSLIESGDLTVDYFQRSESVLFKNFDLYRRALDPSNWAHLAKDHLPPALSYQQRRFYVDKSIPFSVESDRARYKQSKQSATLALDATKLS